MSQLNLNFKKWFEQNTVGKHNDYATGSYLPSTWTGSEVPDTWSMEGRPLHLSRTDLVMNGVPHKEVKGKITQIDIKSNPILVQLDDGTRLYIPIDAARKRINGLDWKEEEANKGKSMHVVFQRHAYDRSENYSQIAWATVS